MKEGLRSSDTRSGVSVIEEINDVDSGSISVKSVVNDISDSGLVNVDNNIVDGDKKADELGLINANSVSKTVIDKGDDNVFDGDNKRKGLDIDLNEVNNENELESSNAVSMPINGEVPGVHDGECILVEENIKKNEMLVRSEVECVDDSLDVSLDGKIEEHGDDNVKNVEKCDENNVENVVISSGLENKLGKLPKKNKNATSTYKGKVDVNDGPEIDTSISKKKRGRPPKKRKRVESNVGVDVESEIVTSGLKKNLKKVSKKKIKATSTSKGKVDMNADSDINISLMKLKLWRSPKKIKLESNLDANVETTVITSRLRIRSEKIPKKKQKAKSTITGKVDVNSGHDIDVSVTKRGRGRPPKERIVEINADVKVESVAVRSGPKIWFGKMPNKKGNSSIFKGKEVVKSVSDTIAVKRKRGRPPKEIKAENNVQENLETAAFKSGPKIWFGKLPMKKGNTSISKGKVVVSADRDTIVAKRKRGRPPKERKAEERDRAGAGVKKGSGVDHDDDEEKDEETLVEREREGERNHGDKHMGKLKFGKDGRGRKRKMESSAHELENIASKKKAKETSFDDESERVGRVLRSRDVTKAAVKGNSKIDVLSKNIIGKMKEETAHCSGRKNEKSKRLRGRPPKLRGRNKSFSRTLAEKIKKRGFKKNGVKSLSKKVIKGSTFEDPAEKQEEEGSSDDEAKKIISKTKEKGVSKGTEKQKLKDSIKEMLINAGWTIDYRPRNGKEYYCDAVYMCPIGRGFWSVTRAYKVLKENVENGKATSREVSAFVPIEEDEWNSLLRTTQKKKKSKKSKEVKDNQSSKVISQKKIHKKKLPKERDRSRLKHKESIKKSNGKEKKNKKRFALLVRGSKKGPDSSGEDFLLYEGKRSLLSWMIDLGTLSLGVKVKCMNSRKTKILLEGKVTKDGIKCDCCNKTFALSEFEVHSGMLLGQPLQSIFLDSKTSLLQCLRDSWNKHGNSMSLGFHTVNVDGDDPNDDTCNMCGDGGNLICCDSCPSAIHQKCLNIQKFPSGDWNCNYCSCKYCGTVGESTHNEDQNCETSSPVLPTCRLCEEKYHPQCVEGKDASHDEPNSPTFCSQKCQEIFQQLDVLFGVKHQLEEGFSWTLLKYSDDNPDISSISGAKIVECNAKLAVAWSIMDECFLPIVDQRSGINMIHNVVYSCGSNIRRLNYTGFFIAILERGDEIISAATLRIHGNLLAEMPFIGTRYTYRRQGMCRRLLSAIETALCSLNVEKLVLPAISEVHETWTSVFDFMPLEDSHKKEMKCMNIIAFPGVDMLQKPVEKKLMVVENSSSATAAVDDPASQVLNVSLNEPSQDFATIDEDNSKKEDANEINKQKNVPSGSDDVDSNGNSKLNEHEHAKSVDITVVSEAISDTINCETNTAHLSDVKEIVGCVLNGEVNAINHSRDQLVVNDHGPSSQALVLV